MWWLSNFTDRVKHIEIKDQAGNKHNVTIERSEEDVCTHKQIEQVVGTFWKCMNCKEFYFEITYKVMLTSSDLQNLLETMAQELKTSINFIEKDEADTKK